MITKHSLLKMARHIARRGDGYPDRRIMHPARDWFIGLVGAGVLFLGGSTAAGHLFWSNLSAEEYEATIDAVKYDQKLVARVLADYRARRALYESLHIDFATSSENVSADVSTSTAPTAPSSNPPPVAEGE